MSNQDLPPRDAFARAAYPDALRGQEQKWIRERRDHALDPQVPVPKNEVGVGISGGGIRSATFALGVFQALARCRLVRTVDFLSTVSGGGYLGAFLGRLFGRPFIREKRQGMDDVEDALAEKPGDFPGSKSGVGAGLLARSAPTRTLRENGRYLAPTGGGDLLLAAAGLLRNWVVVQLTVWVSLASLFLLLRVAQRALCQVAEPLLQRLPPQAQWLGSHGGVALAFVLALLLLWIVPAGWGYWVVDKLRILVPADRIVTPPMRRHWAKARLFGPGIVTAVLLACLAALWFGEPPPYAKSLLVPLALVAGALVWLAAVLGSPSGLGDRDAGGEGREVPEVPEVKEESIAVLAPLGPSVALALSTLVTLLPGPDRIVASWIGVGGVGLTLVTLIFVSIMMVWPEQAGETAGPEGSHHRPIGRLRWFRNLITRSLKRALVVAGTVLLLAGVAWASAKLHALLFDPDPAVAASVRSWFGGLAASIGVVLAFAKRIVMALGGGAGEGKSERPSLTPALLANLAAFVVASVLLVGSDLLARLLLDDAKAAFGDRMMDGLQERWSLAAVLFAGILVFAMGSSQRLLNLTSQQNFYGQRLIRAYLGSSNGARLNGNVALAEAVKSDDALPAEYWCKERGAPLHLINVTINETVAGRSQVEQRDRKGLPLAIGPCGVSAGLRHHALVDWKQDPPVVGERAPASGSYRVFGDGFAPQTLTIGEWTAISGAAFSTGLGARTNLGMSLLCGLANVRLGFWWDAHVRRGANVRAKKLRRQLSRLLPLQSYLLNELLAQFPGTSWRHWYLSDGGHYENLGGYELIRRQLKCMVIVDGEQDADYRFEGLGNLVRLARVDFGADVRFLDEAELDAIVHPDWRSVFGSLDHLQRGNWTGAGSVPEPQAGRAAARLGAADPAGRSLAHAALARVRYPGTGGVGCLLYLKTTMVGDEPVDLAHYHSQNADFPHESTTDQFFDEPQWESYRMLGDHVASKLFDPARRHPRPIGGPPIPPAATGSWEPEHLLRGVLPIGLEQLE